jgi:hypothetical protein
MTSNREDPLGEHLNTSSAAEDMAAQSMVSSPTTPVWWRAAARILVGR